MAEIDCPFCGDDGFDAVGLKKHLIGSGYFGVACEGWEQADSDEEWERTHPTPETPHD